MKLNIELANKSKIEIARKLSMFASIALSFVAPMVAGAQDIGTLNGYYSVKTLVLAGGSDIDELTINGPPVPPPGFELERTPVSLPRPAGRVNTLTVPAFNWVFGCSSVSGAMIAGYLDWNGYPNMYTGPTNGGVMPMNNNVWPTWSDGYATYPNLPLAGSRNGVDGRLTRGSIDDYWVKYGSDLQDPYVTYGWAQHSWGTAIGDYMKTSQKAYGNTDGSTHFYTWNSSPDPLTAAQMVSSNIHTLDGTYGRKLFYEARGYTVTECYNQKTDNNNGGFTFAKYKAEIDAGQPVLLNLAGHSIVGVGYDDSSNKVYIHDTWDYNAHSMVWGGSYSGMGLISVSIVHLGTPPTAGGFNSQFNGSKAGWSQVKGSWGLSDSKYYRSSGLARTSASAKHSDIYGDFVYEVRMKRTGIGTGNANRVIIRGTPSSLSSSYHWRPAYEFQYTNTGYFSIWRTSYTGESVQIKGWTKSASIVKNGWNTLKVSANGASLRYFINGHAVWSGSNSSITKGQVGVGFYRDASAGALYVDWAKLTTTTASAGESDTAPERMSAGAETPGGDVNQAP